MKKHLCASVLNGGFLFLWFIYCRQKCLHLQFSRIYDGTCLQSTRTRISFAFVQFCFFLYFNACPKNVTNFITLLPTFTYTSDCNFLSIYILKQTISQLIIDILLSSQSSSKLLNDKTCLSLSQQRKYLTTNKTFSKLSFAF